MDFETYLLTRLEKRKFMIFWKFPEANKKNDDGLNGKSYATLF